MINIVHNLWVIDDSIENLLLLEHMESIQSANVIDLHTTKMQLLNLTIHRYYYSIRLTIIIVQNCVQIIFSKKYIFQSKSVFGNSVYTSEVKKRRKEFRENSELIAYFYSPQNFEFLLGSGD